MIIASGTTPFDREAAAGPCGLVAVTPSDTTPVYTDTNGVGSFTCRALLLTAAGAVSLKMIDGNSVAIPSGGLALGVIHKLAFSHVLATGTTATGIYAGR